MIGNKISYLILSYLISCPCTMKNDLLQFGFDYAICFDVIVTLVFFNNLRLKRGCLFKFENNQF